MISEQCERYCKEDISLIENYDKAVADHDHIWECHHRDEIKTLPSGIVVYRSAADLKESGRYWKCPANELIFLTESEHMLLHAQNPESKIKRRNSLPKKLAKLYWYKKYSIGYVQLRKIVHLGKEKIIELDKSNKLGELLRGQR